VARDVNDGLNKATALREQAKAAPDGSAALFAQAREQVQRALALVENGPADDTLKTQVTRLRIELDEEDKDRKLVAALEEARLAQAEVSTDKFGPAFERAVPLFRKAFRAYELPPGEGEPTVVAKRIRQRSAAVREAIIAALDEWDTLAADKKLAVTEPHQEWLRAVLAAAEPAEGWTRQFRAARQEKDEAKRKRALENLAAADDVVTRPVRDLTRLAWQLDKVDAQVSRVRLLRRAQQQYPGDFWVNLDLGVALHKVTPPERDEAVRFMTAAVALRPDSPGPYLSLGGALCSKGQLDEGIACWRKAIELSPKLAMAHYDLGAGLAHKGQVDEAIACYKKAIALDPKLARAHMNLGLALKDKGRLDEAIVCWRKAIEVDPKLASAHHNLGVALAGKGQVDEAIASLKKSVELDPKEAGAHENLGVLLKRKGQSDEAIACYKKAIALDPKYVLAHNGLGLALAAKGQGDEAIACYKKVIALDPKFAAAHLGLGNALARKGRWDEAIVCYKKAVALGPNVALAHNNLGLGLYLKGQLDEATACFKKAIAVDPKFAQARTLLAQAERLAAARDKLPAFQNGSYAPASNAERLSLAEWCQIKKLHHTATRLYAAAFAAAPKLADDLKAGHRYNAVCDAALAAAGQGEDAAKLDDKEKARLRQQALDWLRADLALPTKQLESGQPAERTAAQQALRHWQKDADLAGIRDASALTKLPAQERETFTQLWADVAALLKKTEQKRK
jgi:tetratricopeptide (TPR) repeat protein